MKGNKILLGALLVVFLMLMMPVNSAVEFSNKNVPTLNTPNEDKKQIYNGLQKPLGDDIQVPDCVEPGDILLIDVGGWDESTIWKVPGPYNEHAALYIGNNYFIHAGHDNNETVSIKNYARFYWPAKNIAFIRVKTANLSQKQAAIDWAYDRVGAPYQEFTYPPWFTLMIANPDFPHSTANKWFCMELVWAAYYNQGINIFGNKVHRYLPFGITVPWYNRTSDEDIEIIYREINDSTEFIKPYKGVYFANKKIFFTLTKSIIFGSIDVKVKTLNKNITRMDFYIDNVFQESVENKPYIWTWDEICFGKKLITVVASDDFGNKYYTNITVWKFG